MNPEKLTMLTAKTVNMEGGRGGIPEITAQDVAAAMGMAKLNPLEAAILYTKYAGHGDDGQILEMTMDRLRDYEWSGHQMTQRIAAGAVGRFLGLDRCEWCEGTGVDWTGPLPMVCGECKGSGIVPDDYRYDAQWQARYRMILAMLEWTEDEAVRLVRI